MWGSFLRRDAELRAGFDGVRIVADGGLIGIVDLPPETRVVVELLGDGRQGVAGFDGIGLLAGGQTGAWRGSGRGEREGRGDWPRGRQRGGSWETGGRGGLGGRLAAETGRVEQRCRTQRDSQPE